MNSKEIKKTNWLEGQKWPMACCYSSAQKHKLAQALEWLKACGAVWVRPVHGLCVCVGAASSQPAHSPSQRAASSCWGGGGAHQNYNARRRSGDNSTVAQHESSEGSGCRSAVEAGVAGVLRWQWGPRWGNPKIGADLAKSAGWMGWRRETVPARGGFERQPEARWPERLERRREA
jgi:hypothetical protein